MFKTIVSQKQILARGRTTHRLVLVLVDVHLTVRQIIIHLTCFLKQEHIYIYIGIIDDFNYLLEETAFWVTLYLEKRFFPPRIRVNRARRQELS